MDWMALSLALILGPLVSVPQIDQKVNGDCNVTLGEIGKDARVKVDANCGVSRETVDNLNKLLKLQEKEIEALQISNLEKEERIKKIAEEWLKKYKDLEARLQAGGVDAADIEKARRLLKEGKLEELGRMLDETLPEDEKRLAAKYFMRGQVYDLQFERLKAQPHYKKAYTLQPENFEYANDYALILKNQNQFDEAERIYDNNLLIIRKKNLENEGALLQLAITKNNLGVLYSDTRRMDQAENAYMEALSLYQFLTKFNEKKYLPSIAGALINLGVFYRESLKLRKAEAAYFQALNIFEELSKSDPKYLHHVGVTLNNLGFLLFSEKRIKEAREILEDALKIRRKLQKIRGQAYSFHVAETLINIGILNSETLDVDEAEKALREALNILQNLVKSNRQRYLPYVASVESNFGLLYFNIDDFENAEKHVDEALKLWRSFLKINLSVYGNDFAKGLTLKALILTKKGNKKAKACFLLFEGKRLAFAEDLKANINQHIYQHHCVKS